DRPQKIGRFGASAAHFALHHELFVRVELGVSAWNLAERNELSAGNSIDLPLVGLADVDNPQFVATVQTLFEFDGGDFKNIVCAHRCNLRHGRTEAAELLVVDELCHGG